jgi:hypothetical protein
MKILIFNLVVSIITDQDITTKIWSLHYIIYTQYVKSYIIYYSAVVLLNGYKKVTRKITMTKQL